MNLGESQRVVLEYLRENGASTAEEVGKNLYVIESASNLCGRNKMYAYRSTTWARRILRSLVDKGLIKCDYSTSTRQFVVINEPQFKKENVKLLLGTFQDSIQNQLKEQGWYLSDEHNERFQKIANSIKMLQLHGFMSDSLCRVTRRRLIKQILKQIRPIKNEV